MPAHHATNEFTPCASLQLRFSAEPFAVSENAAVVKSSMLDKESAELEAMRAAALKVAQEGGGAAAGEDGGVFSSPAAGKASLQGAEASKPGEHCSLMACMRNQGVRMSRANLRKQRASYT